MLTLICNKVSLWLEPSVIWTCYTEPSSWLIKGASGVGDQTKPPKQAFLA